MHVWALSARLILGAVFLMAATAKIRGPNTLSENVAQYRLLPRRLAHVYALSLPWVELAAGLSLVAGVVPRFGAAVALALLASFGIAVASAMARHLSLNCSCFGLLYRERVGRATLLRDGVLAALALVVLGFDRSRLTMHSALSTVHQPSSGLAAAFSGLVLMISLAIAIRGSGRSGFESATVDTEG